MIPQPLHAARTIRNTAVVATLAIIAAALIGAAAIATGRTGTNPILPTTDARTETAITATADTRWTMPAILAEAKWLTQQGNTITPPPRECISLQEQQIQQALQERYRVLNVFRQAVYDRPYYAYGIPMMTVPRR